MTCGSNPYCRCRAEPRHRVGDLVWRWIRSQPGDGSKETLQPMQEMTKKEMEAVLLAHEKGELEEDLDATMATLVDNPHYELPTLGFAFDGYDAVREAYSRIMPG